VILKGAQIEFKPTGQSCTIPPPPTLPQQSKSSHTQKLETSSELTNVCATETTQRSLYVNNGNHLIRKTHKTYKMMRARVPLYVGPVSAFFVSRTARRNWQHTCSHHVSPLMMNIPVGHEMWPPVLVTARMVNGLVVT
jgi:hypothetical protein